MITTYLRLGFDHILDINGYDHILFVIVLCVAYRVTEWRKMLVLVTAFTIGHSLTLALAGMKIVAVNAALIEFLIPITIVLSAALNIWEAINEKFLGKGHYLLAMLFGLIHGLGFSNFFKSLVSPDESIIPLLFSFNIGVELGQIVIVTSVFIAMYIFIHWSKVLPYKWFNICLSTLCGLIALYLLLV